MVKFRLIFYDISERPLKISFLQQTSRNDVHLFPYHRQKKPPTFLCSVFHFVVVYIFRMWLYLHIAILVSMTTGDPSSTNSYLLRPSYVPLLHISADPEFHQFRSCFKLHHFLLPFTHFYEWFHFPFFFNSSDWQPYLFGFCSNLGCCLILLRWE